ncbi:MAG: aminoacyl-tRNA hydrolase, partial [Bacilli bacterium]|nr:aminoacyl-tRNA hydrolase [Bacilli bacterium]
MKLIVGLGNPGKEYDRTKHNMGFMAIDEIARSNNVTIDRNKFNGLYTEF